MWMPQATSKESRLAQYGALEYAWMVWSPPDSLALRRMLPYMVPMFFVLFDVFCLMSLRRPEYRLGSLVCVLVVSWLFVRSCGHILGPLTGGSAPVNVISGSICSSTALRIDSSA